MGFSCPICSEKLEKLPAEAQQGRGGNSHGEINISATPCGHIFHAYCIQKWLTGNMPGNKLCPCCRKDVPKLRCLALFPNTVDDSILDDSLSQAPGGSSVAPCNHGEVIASLKSQITRIEAELREKTQMYDLLSQDYETLLERFRKEKMESDMWMMKAKQFESYKDLARDYEERMQIAEAQLKSYTHIDNVLKGVEISVKDDMKNFPPTSDSVQSLIQTKHILSRELKSVSRRLGELQSSSESIRNEKMKLRVQYDNKVKELKELKKMYEISRLTGRIHSTSPSPVAGPSSLNDSATPKGFRTKRRLQEPSFSNLLANVASPGVDDDVDLFPSGVKTKKTTTKTKPKPSVVLKMDTNEGPSNSKYRKEDAFPGELSPISIVSTPSVTSQDKKPVNLNSTITLDDSNADDDYLLDLEDDDDFKIRGNVPGAPLPMASNKMKRLEEKSKNPILGKISTHKKFKFTKK